VSFEAVESGICGAFYTATDVLQDNQEAINFYNEIDKNESAKEPVALLGCPGLNAIITSQFGQVRGCWPLPGGLTALFVTGGTVYLLTVTAAPTASTIAQFTTSIVGTLLTNSGPVCIRDNGVYFGGAGGYAVIVDGTYGYYYQMAGASTITFAASSVLGQNYVTPTGTVNQYIVSNAVVTDSGGVVPAGTKVSYVNFNNNTVVLTNTISGNVASDTITVSIPQFAQITDPGFLGASRIAFIEGWLIFNEPNSRTFFTTGPEPYTLAFPGLWYALKDSSTDNLVTLYESQRELWLIGERTSEVWYNAGNSVGVTFSRIPGVGPQVGCSAQHSITRMGQVLVWLAKNEQGENVVVAQNQYSVQRISNHAVEHAISQYPLVSDAIGYSYEEDGHVFYVLTFPSADITWCFDSSTDQWHKRLSWNASTGTFHRHYSNCYMDLQNLRIVGDYQNGNLYQMSRKYFTDNGNTIRRLRRTPHIWQKPNRGRVFFGQFQVEFTPGVGLQVGQGINPQAMLRYSDDGGFSWSNEIWVTIGAAGETKNRAIWYLLGTARDRVWEVTFTDPVQCDIIGSSCFYEAAAA
jgi:hypothetical protein